MASPSAPLAYLNGSLVPQDQARLPIHDAGLVWGATITDLCRTVRHQLYRWPDHLARFRRSCQAAGVPLLLADGELTRRAEELAAHNARLLAPELDLALVLVATPGPIGYYLGQPGGVGSGEPTLLMHTFPLPFARYRCYHQQGVHLAIPAVRAVPAVCIDPRLKQRSRLHWYLAEQQAQQVDPQAAALLLDEHGQITETAAANVLIVQQDIVVSPPRHTILEGVSLQVVRELCGSLGLRFEERPLTLYDCRTASEILLTCTSFCLAGVSRINQQPIPWPGSVYQRLLQAWSAAIGLDIRGQIEGQPI